MRYVSQLTALFLAMLILSPVTAPFAPCPLSALMTEKVTGETPMAVAKASVMLPSSSASSVLVEEESKDQVVLEASSVTALSFESVEFVPLVLVWVDGGRSNLLALRL